MVRTAERQRNDHCGAEIFPRCGTFGLAGRKRCQRSRYRHRTSEAPGLRCRLRGAAKIMPTGSSLSEPISPKSSLKNPEVTVIVNTWDSEACIGECLEHIVREEVAQIILVDAH